MWRRSDADPAPSVCAGKLCIEVTPQSKIVWISESLCIGCGICIKVSQPAGGGVAASRAGSDPSLFS